MSRSLPFRHNPKLEARNARLRRLMKAKTIKPLSKDDMRRQAEQAAAGKPIH